MAHRVSPRAEVDLDEIWIYVAKESGSVEIADRLVDATAERFFMLSDFPYIGRSAKSLDPVAAVRPLENTSSFTA